MLYIAIVAISLFTTSKAVCNTDCTANNCPSTQGGCYRDADTSSETYGCDICQSNDPCANYANFDSCDTDYDCQSTTGAPMECKEARWSSNVAGSDIVCPYCDYKEMTTPDPTDTFQSTTADTSCTYDSECGDIMYRCVASTNNGKECMLKCPDEDCVATSGTNSNTCASSFGTAGTCEVDDTSQYYCRRCEYSIPTDPATTADPLTTVDRTTSEPTCEVTYDYISTSSGGAYCGLTLDDCTVIPEDQIDDTYKEYMFMACPNLQSCWGYQVSLNSCQCPRCVTDPATTVDPTDPATTIEPTDPATTADRCDTASGYSCDTTDECIEMLGDYYGCGYHSTANWNCKTCFEGCPGQCVDDGDCVSTTQTGTNAAVSKQGSCVENEDNNLNGCKECVYMDTTEGPIETTQPEATTTDEETTAADTTSETTDYDETDAPTTTDDDDQCCTREDYETYKNSQTGIPFGGYACCPDGTITIGNDAISDPSGEMTMYCDDEEIPIRPINYNLCETDAPTTTDDECECDVSNNNNVAGTTSSCCDDGDCNTGSLTVMMYCIKEAGDVCGYCSYQDDETDAPTTTDDDECCSREDWETRKNSQTAISSGGYACCPDGSIGDQSDTDDVMYCGNYQYPTRPIQDNLCDDEPTTTYDEMHNTKSSGNMMGFMLAIGFILGLFGWM